MKVKVTRDFIDKYTGDLHRVGETFECSEDRLVEIQSVLPDLVQKVADTAPAPVEHVTPAEEAVVGEEAPKKRRTRKTTKKGEE